jgi:membrane protease YdiL (CAAX protease family)
MIISSLIFSYSHLHAIWFVPPEYDKFILYQTAYTLPLAFACAYVLRRQRSLLSSVAVHAAFNFGFFLAFWL